MLDAATTRKALKISTIEGASATVHLVITTGAFLTGYALLLGANDFELGLLTAIPLLTQIFQVAGAYLVEKTGKRKAVATWGLFIGRSMWLPIALIPALPVSEPVRLFILLFGLAGLASNFATPAWVAWMTDLVPRRLRGRYFGKRNRIVALVTMLVSLFAGVILDLARGANHPYFGYLTLQLLAVAAAALAFYFLRRQPEPPYRAEWTPDFAHYISRPLNHTNYRRVILFYLWWVAAVGLAAPFFSAHLIKHLQWNFKSIAYLGILSSATSVLVQPWWGKAVDRYGHKPVITVTVLGMAHLPLYYALCPYDVRWPIYANALLAGVFWSGFNLAMFNLVMYALPNHGRPGFIAIHAALSGVTNFVASSFGGWLAEMLSSVHWHVLGLTVVNYQLLFLLTALLRSPGLLILKRIDEPEAKRTGVLVRQVFIEVNRRMGYGRQVFMLPIVNGRKKLRSVRENRKNRKKNASTTAKAGG